MDILKVSQKVLLLWGPNVKPEDIKTFVGNLQEKVGNLGHVRVENVERLKFSNYEDSTFDVILSGLVHPACVVHNLELLAELARVLKPKGLLTLREPTVDIENGPNVRTAPAVVSSLRLSGFVNVGDPKTVNVSDQECEELKKLLNVDVNVCLIEVHSAKPDFEIGSSAKLSFNFKNKIKDPVADVNNEAAKVWSLSAQDIIDDEVELMNADDLLDDDDRKKPDPSSLLLDCGVNKTGKKKACKNCTCGLAEELDNKTKSSAPTSSCGSCYLGDAFRCSSCPYLGMPPFKQGEKIVLTDRQLKPDA